MKSILRKWSLVALVCFGGALFAVEPQDAKALYESGMRFYDEKNYSEALKYFRPAAELGYAPAQSRLGWC